MISAKVKKTTADIKKIKIQGAHTIAVAAVDSLSGIEKISDIKSCIKLLRDARPTEPMLRNSLDYILYKKDSGFTTKEAIQDYHLMIDEAVEHIAKAGARRIKDGMKIMTRCHSSTVATVLKRAKEQGRVFEVYVAEARPLYQGRITANELSKAGIPVTLIVDSAMRHYINDMDLAMTGADAITSDGFAINKVGTSMMALAAHEARTEFGMVVELLKFDPETKLGEQEKIEMREPKEVWDKPPKGVKVLNPAFDVTPPEYIHFLTTEGGVINPYTMLNVIQSKYPWIDISLA
ncbi:MAG: S-methyl-5-thioribose-1-phosphate isomerase [Candidatus Micrarchaeota archaeon]